MRRAGPLGAFALAVLGLVLAAGLALAAPKFPPLTGRVVDQANLLSPQAETQITERLASLEAQTGRQAVVVTLKDLQGYPIEDYGYQLGRAWGIGDKDRDDGVLLIVAPAERAVRIEVGYGLEPILTDALSSLIIQEQILPAFRRGDMEAGVLAGTEAIVRQLSLPEDEARAIAAQSSRQSSDSSIGIPAIFIILIVFWLIGGVLGAFSPRGRRRSLWWLLPLLLSGGGGGGRGGRGGGFGGGGFSGGGGSFGGGGASGRW
ncbi:MAG: TPM domain-containing protein [Phenylobacterium sp.]|uniref:TPM domain-containing protein n=1 Tax=Phenylobacterium sp. TaxID=1871053 RepID=UPI00391D7886